MDQVVRDLIGLVVCIASGALVTQVINVASAEQEEQEDEE